MVMYVMGMSVEVTKDDDDDWCWPLLCTWYAK